MSTHFAKNCAPQVPDSVESAPTGTMQQACLVTPIVEKIASTFQRKYDLCEAEKLDLLQEGIIAGLAALSTYDQNVSKLSTWISIRAKGEMLDALRKLRTGGITGAGVIELADGEISSLEGVNFDPEDEESDTDLFLGSVATEHPSDDPVLGAEIAEMLEFLAELPAEDQLVITMKCGLGGGKVYTLREIADALHMSEVAVFKRYAKALQVLSEKMS